MPRGDGTGPMGMGPMTGRGAGYCTGYATANSGVGFGRGIGGGRGLRRMFCFTGLPAWARNDYPATANEQAFDEKTALKNQEEFLENQLKQIKERLKNMNEQK